MNMSTANRARRCGHDHEHAPVRLWQTLIGVVFVLNAFLVDWVFKEGNTVASASGLIGAVILGYPIVWTAIKDIRTGVLSINELVAIAVLAAFASGEYKTAGVVAFFMLLGEIIETRTAEGARASIEPLIKLTPTKARRITPQGEEEVAARDLAVGDVIRIRPGDNVAADGVILSGQGSFNQATITGESLPADKKPGDEVFAGTQNLTGVLEIKVSRAGTDTTLGRVRELILAAEKTKLPIMKIVDQYMGFYTPLVLVIAALVWAFTRRPGQRHLGHHLQLPLRLHPGDAHGDGGRAVRRRAPGHPHQERRRHRAGRQDQRLCFRQDRHAHDRGTGGQPPGAAQRRHAGRTAACRGVRREIQQPPDRQSAGATGRRSRRAAGGTEGLCRNRRTRREGRGGRRHECWWAGRSGCGTTACRRIS